MNPEEPLPLRLTVIDPTERFPLRFAQLINEILDPGLGVICTACRSGVVLTASSELKLNAVIAIIADRFPKAEFGKVEVMYLTEPEWPEWREPCILLRVRVNADYWGDVMGDLVRRMATIENSAYEEPTMTYTAEGPLAEFIGYEDALKGSSRGTGEVEYEFTGYKHWRAKPIVTPPPPLRHA